MVFCLCAASWGGGGGCSSPCCYPLVVAAPPTGYGHLLALGCLVGCFSVVADLLPWSCGLWLAWTSLLHWGSTDCAQAPSSDCAGMAGLCQGQLPSASGSLALLPFSCGPPSSLNRGGGHTLDFQHWVGSSPVCLWFPGDVLQSLTLIIKYVS